MAEFVPPDFDVPLGLEASEFVLEPLGPKHNQHDCDGLDVVHGAHRREPGSPTALGRER